jgi:hypothetical protein
MSYYADIYGHSNSVLALPVILPFLVGLYVYTADFQGFNLDRLIMASRSRLQ